LFRRPRLNDWCTTLYSTQAQNFIYSRAARTKIFCAPQKIFPPL